jgi:methionyl-tRNA formyltransferase
LPQDTGGSLHDRLAPLGAQALMEALPQIAAGEAAMSPQDDAQSTYAAKLNKEEATLDWRLPALELERKVRAFNPWPVAQTRYAGQVLRLWSAHAVAGSAEPGRVSLCGKDALDVGAGDGLLRISQLQLPGKRAMSVSDFLNAHDPSGALLG